MAVGFLNKSDTAVLDCLELIYEGDNQKTVKNHAMLNFTVPQVIDELVTLNPETFLKESLLRPADYVWNAIIQFRPQFKLGEFPMTAWLACCEDPDDRYGKLWRQAQKATTKAEHQSLMKVAMLFLGHLLEQKGLKVLENRHLMQLKLQLMMLVQKLLSKVCEP